MSTIFLSWIDLERKSVSQVVDLHGTMEVFIVNYARGASSGV